MIVSTLYKVECLLSTVFDTIRSMCHMKTANISPYDPKKEAISFSKGKWVML